MPASYDIVGVAVSPVALIESESWTALFSLAERHPGRVVVPDNADDVIGAVLVSLGHAWDSDSNSDLDDAATRLGELFPSLRVLGRRAPRRAAGLGQHAAGAAHACPQLPAHVDRPALLRAQRGLGAGRAKLLHPHLRPAPGGRARVAEQWLEPSVEAGAVAELRLPVPLEQARPLIDPKLAAEPGHLPAAAGAGPQHRADDLGPGAAAA